MTADDGKSVRMRLRSRDREVEVEGPADFVLQQIESLRGFLDATPSPTSAETSAPSASSVGAESFPATFGEYYQHYKKDIADTDRALVAGAYAQAKSPDNQFTTGDVNTLLMAQGVKLANPSDAVAKNLKKGNVFGLEKGRFRVSSDGIEYLAKLKKEGSASSSIG